MAPFVSSHGLLTGLLKFNTDQFVREIEGLKALAGISMDAMVVVL